jgi:hypothetical protein
MHLHISPGTLGSPVPMTAGALALAGFTATEIARLTALRERCTLIEFLDATEVEQLAFLKWRYDHGRLGGAAADDEGQVAMT